VGSILCFYKAAKNKKTRYINATFPGDTQVYEVSSPVFGWSSSGMVLGGEGQC